MKKTILGLALILGAAALFGQEAVIREIAGTVELKAPGSAEWRPARQGQSITRNTLVSTGFKSIALIALGNSTLTVQPLTRLSLEELIRAEENEKVEINLRAGRIRADVKPPVGGGTTGFTVRSPTATASVRGTVFEFNGIRLSVDEGRVHFSGGDRSGTYVGPGRGVSTDPESGRTLGVRETVMEALTLPLPAGVEIAPEQRAAASLAGTVDAGFDWR
ncbi:MAG: FecR family protein [Treponema sp.]|nr:FecR family protein [Treponema sp.]